MLRNFGSSCLAFNRKRLNEEEDDTYNRLPFSGGAISNLDKAEQRRLSSLLVVGVVKQQLTNRRQAIYFRISQNYKDFFLSSATAFDAVTLKCLLFNDYLRHRSLKGRLHR